MNLVKLSRAALPMAALLLLTGCGQVSPGTAATVGKTRITDSQVQDLVDAQCAGARRARTEGQPSVQALSKLQSFSLRFLVDNELTKQYAAHRDITPNPAIVNGFYQQFQRGIDPLPEPARSDLAAAFKDWAVGRAVLVQAGSERTGRDPDAGNIQDLLVVGLHDRERWQEHVDIESDPVYGSGIGSSDGTGGDASVSRPVSDFARKASASQADPAWVSALPTSQRCG